MNNILTKYKNIGIQIVHLHRVVIHRNVQRGKKNLKTMNLILHAHRFLKEACLNMENISIYVLHKVWPENIKDNQTIQPFAFIAFFIAFYFIIIF